MSKRPGSALSSLVAAKKANLAESIANQRPVGGNGLNNPFLVKPVQPEQVFAIFLTQVRNTARKYLPKGTAMPIAKPFCEVEARIGILKINNRRVTSSGQKRINGTVVQAFDATSLKTEPSMESGVSRSHFVNWTQSGISETSPLSSALGCVVRPNMPPKEAISMIKRDLVENEYVETVFAGYGERRLCFPGYVDAHHPVIKQPGQMEYKEKLQRVDLIVPAAKYDLRIELASEKVVVPNQMSVPDGWSVHRVKRRRSYKRKDTNMAWQIDVTEVTSTPRANHGKTKVDYEIEMEIQGPVLLELINEESQEKVASLTKKLAQQLWWMLQQINPMEETINVEELLQEHPNKQAVQLALATCGALKRYMENPPSPTSGPGRFDSPIAHPHETPSPALTNMKFCGCMPVNFSRHNIEEIQQAPENGYYLSEKTDGVRHFMVFTGDTVVLVDRAMKGKQPIPVKKDGTDPMAPVLRLVKPGTVLDGEVVMHRGTSRHKARPVFIVFDVLTISTNIAVLHMPFESRLHMIRAAEFATSRDEVFADSAVADLSITMPLVRKNFVHRTQVSTLLQHVVEEKGFRSYRKLPVYNHLTDGIIFQPNLPYVCGTDVNLLKWKYLDTMTIDVEIVQGGYNHHHNNNNNNNHGNDESDALNTGVMGPDQTSVDMSRYIKLPASERYRLEADRFESGVAIAEVGFDPLSGEWYYLTMRADKVAPNHISTVLGTLLELSESLTSEELQYRLSVPHGQRDTYRKDLKRMLQQLLDHQRRTQEQQRN
jgi:hypothetical protein